MGKTTQDGPQQLINPLYSISTTISWNKQPQHFLIPVLHWFWSKITAKSCCNRCKRKHDGFLWLPCCGVKLLYSSAWLPLILHAHSAFSLVEWHKKCWCASSIVAETRMRNGARSTRAWRLRASLEQGSWTKYEWLVCKCSQHHILPPGVRL